MLRSFTSEGARRVALRALLVERRREIRPADPGESAELKEGLSQADVAELAGVSLNWYQLFESGRGDRRVSPDFVERVAFALQLEGPDKLELFQLAFGDADALAQIRRTAEDGALALLRTVRTLAAKIAEARDFLDVARAVAETFHAAVRPSAATVSVMREGDGLRGFALGPRAEAVSEAQFQVIWCTRAALPADQVGVVERGPAIEELAQKPVDINIVAVGDDEQRALSLWKWTPEAFLESPAYLMRARSSLSLPLMEGNTLRGLTVLYWTAPRTFSRVEIEAARAVAAVVQAVTRLK